MSNLILSRQTLRENFVHAKCWQRSWIAPLPSRYLTTFKLSLLTKFLSPTIDVWVLILIKPLYPALSPNGYRNLKAEESNYRLAREGRGCGEGGVGEKALSTFFSSLFSGPSLVETCHASWTLCSLPFFQYAKYQDQNPPPKLNFNADPTSHTSRRYITVLCFCYGWDYHSWNFNKQFQAFLG